MFQPWKKRSWRPDMERDGDEVRKLREDMDHLPGQVAAQRRLSRHHAVFPAFNSLDIFDTDTARAYLFAPLNAVKVPEDQRGRLMGVVLAFAITCVEADRENRDADVS